MAQRSILSLPSELIDGIVAQVTSAPPIAEKYSGSLITTR